MIKILRHFLIISYKNNQSQKTASNSIKTALEEKHTELQVQAEYLKEVIKSLQRDIKVKDHKLKHFLKENIEIKTLLKQKDSIIDDLVIFFLFILIHLETASVENATKRK